MKISIIVPSYNQGKFIERALRSLEKQDDENLEILVMDGGSTDNSVEVIHKFEHIITYWQSEKDRGAECGHQRRHSAVDGQLGRLV